MAQSTGSYVVLASFTAEALPLPPHDHGDTRSDATDLALGSSVRGHIGEGDDDYFHVQVKEAGTLAVYTTSSLDTVGELQAGDGSILASDDDGGDGLNFRIEHDVGPGAYYVRVSSYGTATGGYVVQVSFAAEELPLPPTDDHGNTRSDATDLALGISVRGQIAEANDEDYFQVQVTQTGILVVYTTGDLDTVGQLQAGDGSILASDDDDGNETSFRIEHTVGPGAYYIRVGSYGPATGDYVVLASFVANALPPPPHDHGDTRSDATDLALGGSVRGQIAEANDEDYFHVQVAQAGILAVYTTGDLDTVGQLQAGDGSILASDDDGGDGLNFRIERDVGPGTYYVKARSYGTATGSYVVLASFAAEKLPLPPTDDHGDTRPDATDLVLESSVQGQIEEGDDDDYFKVQVTQAGTLTVYTTGSLDTLGELEASDGSILASDDDSGEGLNFRFENNVGPGTHYVRVGSFSREVGGYSIFANFEAGDSDTIAGAISVPVGSSTSARIDRLGDVDYFRFRVAHTGTLTVWATGEVATELVLLDSAGNELRTASTPLASGGGSTIGVLVATTNIGQNIISREVAVRAGATVLAKVTGQRSGSYTLGNRNIRLGVTNVISGTPAISISAGSGPTTVELSGHFDTSKATGQLTYSATFDRPVLVGGVPLGVGISVEGSIMTIQSQESGPAYSGSIGIRVEVRDPFGLFAFKVLDIGFTREAASQPPSDAQGCVSAQVMRKVTYCPAILTSDGSFMPKLPTAVTEGWKSDMNGVKSAMENHLLIWPEALRPARRIPLCQQYA